MTLARNAAVEHLADVTDIETLKGLRTPAFGWNSGPGGDGAVRPDSSKTLSVLLVDDDEVDAKYICWLLGCIGRYRFDIVHVTSSEEALRADSGRRFDLYLVDFWLMHETSIPLISELGELHTRAPIVVLTNLNSGDIEDLGMRAGALGFLGKGDLSEKALELVISSTLFTRRVELELKEQITKLEQQRQQALIAGQAALLKVLSGLDTAQRYRSDLRKDVGGNVAEDALSDSIASTRQGVFAVLGAYAVGDDPQVLPQPVDLRTIIGHAIESYRTEARIRGVALAVNVPSEPLRLAAHPVLLQALLVGLFNRISQGGSASVSIDATVQARSIAITIAAEPISGTAASPADIDAFRVLAQSMDAEIEISQPDGASGGGDIVLTLPRLLAA